MIHRFCLNGEYLNKPKSKKTIELEVFSPGEFQYIVSLAIDAGQRRDPAVAVKNTGIKDPYSRAAAVLQPYFEGDSHAFNSALVRFSGLMHLFSGQQLGAWVRTNVHHSDSQDIHPAVIHVAAQMGVNKNGKFPPRRFIREVENVAAQYYYDLPGWS